MTRTLKDIGLSGRVTSTPWYCALTFVRELAGLTKFAVCRKTGHKVQSTSLKKYEEGEQSPSIERFVELVEACGGVVIVRSGTTEWHITSGEL